MQVPRLVAAEDCLSDRSLSVLQTIASTQGPPLTLIEAANAKPYVLSRDELITRAARLARHFRDLGMQPGDKVVMLMPACVAFVTSLVALWFNGAVSVPVAHRSSSRGRAMWVDNLRHIIGAAKPRFVLGTDAALAAVAPLAGAGDARRPVIVSMSDLAEAAQNSADPELPAPPDVDRWAHCQFTSGSTGKPHGVVVSHQQIALNLQSAARRVGVREGDVFLSWLPLHHDMGFIGGLLFPLHLGIPSVLATTDVFARAPHVWPELISRYRVSMSPAPTFAYDLLATRVPDSRLQGLDLSCWRYAWVGAEPIFPRTLTGFRARFRMAGLPSYALAPCYGLADRKSTRLNSSHPSKSRMPSSA